MQGAAGQAGCGVCAGAQQLLQQAACHTPSPQAVRPGTALRPHIDLAHPQASDQTRRAGSCLPPWLRRLAAADEGAVVAPTQALEEQVELFMKRQAELESGGAWT